MSANTSRRRAGIALAATFCRETDRLGKACYQCVDSAMRMLVAAGVEQDVAQDVEPVVGTNITIRCRNMGEHVAALRPWQTVTEPACGECTSIVAISVRIPGQPNVRTP